MTQRVTRQQEGDEAMMSALCNCELLPNEHEVYEHPTTTKTECGERFLPDYGFDTYVCVRPRGHQGSHTNLLPATVHPEGDEAKQRVIKVYPDVVLQRGTLSGTYVIRSAGVQLAMSTFSESDAWLEAASRLTASCDGCGRYMCICAVAKFISDPKLPTPEETTLPAIDVADSDNAKFRAEVQRLENKILWFERNQRVIDSYVEETKFYHDAAIKAEAERDALKAEVDKWKSYRNAWTERAEAAERRLSAYNCGGFADADAVVDKYLDAINELSTLRTQLDAVVGQETPQDIWERGFEQGWLTSNDGIECEVPPYRPPLKAGW